MNTNKSTDTATTQPASPEHDRTLIQFFDADRNPATSEVFATYGPHHDFTTATEAIDEALTDHWKIHALDESPRDIWKYAVVFYCEDVKSFGWGSLTDNDSADGDLELDPEPAACFPSDPDESARYLVHGNYYQDLHDPLHFINIVSAESARDAAILAPATAPHNGDGHYSGHEARVRKLIDQKQFKLSDPLFDSYFGARQEVDA